MRISTRGDYACRALLSLALHGDEAGPTSVRDIAERTGLPQPYLEQILLALKGAGLVRSKRGVGGGYVLNRPAEEIRLSRMRRAQYLLVNTSEQILSVALRSGFRSVSGFDRSFRERTGLTPREYRRKFGPHSRE